MSTAAPSLRLLPTPNAAVSGPAASRTRPGPEVYRRRRLVVCALVLAVVGSMYALGGRATASRGADAELPATGVAYVVQPGDTLWSIAVAMRPDDDPRRLTHELGAQVDGSVLQVGQRLWLPAAIE